MWKSCISAAGLVVLLGSAGAEAARFSLPTHLNSFHYAGQQLSAGSPIEVLMKEHPGICDDVGVYTYTDSARATAGLGAYLQQIGMTAKDLQRSEHAALWTAQGAGGELTGVWRAAEGGGGQLEMCGQAAPEPASTRKRGSSGLFWLAGAGLFVASRVARRRARL